MSSPRGSDWEGVPLAITKVIIGGDGSADRSLIKQLTSEKRAPATGPVLRLFVLHKCRGALNLMSVRLRSGPGRVLTN